MSATSTTSPSSRLRSTTPGCATSARRFVVSPTGALGAVDWVFNGWGAQPWATWGNDELVGAFVGGQAGAEVIGSAMVNEGGGIHVDGQGTVLLTETVQLDPGRNPGLTRADVEAELTRTIGGTAYVWLPRGLTRDYDEFGTRGHVDIVAAFAAPGRGAAALAGRPHAPRLRRVPGARGGRWTQRSTPAASPADRQGAGTAHHP